MLVAAASRSIGIQGRVGATRKEPEEFGAAPPMYRDCTCTAATAVVEQQDWLGRDERHSARTRLYFTASSFFRVLVFVSRRRETDAEPCQRECRCQILENSEPSKAAIRQQTSHGTPNTSSVPPLSAGLHFKSVGARSELEREKERASARVHP